MFIKYHVQIFGFILYWFVLAVDMYDYAVLRDWISQSTEFKNIQRSFSTHALALVLFYGGSIIFNYSFMAMYTQLKKLDAKKWLHLKAFKKNPDEQDKASAKLNVI